MPPAARRRPEISLETFLRGWLAVLALKGRRRVRSGPGILDAALAGVLQDVAKAANRARVRLPFRLRPDALSSPSSNLSKAVRALVRGGLLQEHRGEYEILIEKDEAFDILRTLDLPLEVFERAANAFRRRQEVAKIRALAQRLRDESATRARTFKSMKA